MDALFPGVHKIGAAISGPRIADKNFTDTRIVLIQGLLWMFFAQGAAKGGVIKGGVCKRKRTCANADKRTSQALRKGTQNEGKSAKTRANADKREQTQNQRIAPPFIQRKTKGQKLKGKIVSYFSHFLALFHTFSEFFPQDFPLQNKGL